MLTSLKKEFNSTNRHNFFVCWINYFKNYFSRLLVKHIIAKYQSIVSIYRQKYRPKLTTMMGEEYLSKWIASAAGNFISYMLTRFLKKVQKFCFGLCFWKCQNTCQEEKKFYLLFQDQNLKSANLTWDLDS